MRPSAAGAGMVATVTSSIGVGLIAALSLLWQSHQAEQATAREASVAIDRQEPEYDRRIVQAIREVVPRESVEWLSGCSFGYTWDEPWTKPFFELDKVDNPEHEPFDKEIAGKLRALFDASKAFTRALNEHSFLDTTHYGPGNKRHVGWTGDLASKLEGEERRLYETRRDTLNGVFASVADAYEDFIKTARDKRLLGALNER